jgi:hypothetical protein
MRPTVQFSPKNNKRIMFLRDTNAPASSLYSTKSYNLSHQTMTTSCSREAKAQKSQSFFLVIFQLQNVID